MAQALTAAGVDVEVGEVSVCVLMCVFLFHLLTQAF